MRRAVSLQHVTRETCKGACAQWWDQGESPTTVVTSLSRDADFLRMHDQAEPYNIVALQLQLPSYGTLAWEETKF